MAIRFILDSDVLIDLLADREPAATIIPTLLELEVAATTAVTVYELYSGAGRAGDRRDLNTLLSSLTILPLDARSARYAGAVDHSLRRDGHPINPGDTLIAGICLANSLAIVSRNVRHFERVTGLRVISLQDLVV
ncbi:MAG: type II toxin-antitoxin system VapC family toxin [Candidatus Methylomirabilis oxyfera]|nr:type II toxin-antitoxin system VapC family toxin [Candidatus Methylomirabilis oxyfera]